MSNLQKHLITKGESEVLSREYDTSNYAAINKIRPAAKPDSKTYTYELEVLQDYINLIRDGLEKQGVKNKGIKISLGKYPESGFTDRLDPKYKGYQTVFFTAVDLDDKSENESDKKKGSGGLPGLDFGQLCPP
ncbi:hypothetical protein [Kaistella carnis]|uniref:Uncharacterized protein n=1 Tax=Kaistella carnis TaxID=1241979 RepID=A0A3G8XK80_9FLAO|nr:hypothetical protein [Kaistella carnis]AZI32147.1 hypothetical protein EIB73_02670 [Kaistella carnis]